MKKIIKILVFLCVVLSFCSCSFNNNKIMLTGNIENENTITLTKEMLKEKIDNNDDFLLIITLKSCSSCNDLLSSIIVPFIKKTHSDIYSIDAYELDMLEDFSNKPVYESAPTIHVYKNGKSIKKINYKIMEENFSTLEKFTKYMEKYIIEPKIVVTSEKILDDMLANKQTFILYIGWEKCGDCTAINDLVLKDYLLKQDCKNIIYYLECDEYRKNKPAVKPVLSDNPTDEQIQELKNYLIWLEFASKYNFASYRDGRVPTIQYYEKGMIEDMIVYKNDLVEQEKIVNSYFNELIGKDYESDKITDFHNKKVIEFLDKYYKNNSLI